MRLRTALALGLFFLFGTVAYAQDKTEAGLNYSYTRFNPENSSWTSGGFSLNGGGGSITYFFTDHLGIKGEFEGTTSQTRTLTNKTSPPCAPTSVPCTASFQANLLTYNAIVVYKARMHKIEPYVEGGFGGAHSNAYVNAIKACATMT